MEIVHKDNIEIWKGCHILNHFVEVNGSETKKILFDFFEKNPQECNEFLLTLKSKIERMSSNCQKFRIKISPALVKELKCSEGMHGSVLKPERKEELKVITDKCVINSKPFQILLDEAGKHIVEYIEKELLTIFADINHIIFVGEFAQSPIIREIIKTTFSTKNIIIPWDTNMAAVRGAVFFGQRSISVETNTVHTMKQTPLNNAQAALAEGRGIEKKKKENTKAFQKKYKKKSPLKRCVIM